MVDQNSNDFTFSLRQVLDANRTNSARIPYDADAANVSFEFNIIGPFNQATAQCRIKDRRQRDRVIYLNKISLLTAALLT